MWSINSQASCKSSAHWRIPACPRYTFGIPGTRAYKDHPLWRKDPKTAVFPETLQHARQVGHAGPPGRKATEALSKYIIVDMFAKSIQGLAPEEAVKWAEGELKKIYGA